MGNEKKLKIVKWTAGLDRSVIGKARQLYPAFGDDLSDLPCEEFNRLWHDADLAEQVGSVEMERFIMLLNRDSFDYTEWRKDNLLPGETVDSLCDKIEEFQSAQRDRTFA